MKIILASISLLTIWLTTHIDTPPKYNPYIIRAAVQTQTVKATADIESVSPPYARKQHEIQTSVCKNSHTNEYYKGELVGREEVYYWASKYWSGNDLEIAVALTVPEGQRDLYCIGDETAPYYRQPTGDGRHYGYSVGLYQWRTVIEQTGKGGCEDANWQLGNIERQTQCAYEKYKKNRFQPWTAYTRNRYQEWLGK